MSEEMYKTTYPDLRKLAEDLPINKAIPFCYCGEVASVEMREVNGKRTAKCEVHAYDKFKICVVCASIATIEETSMYGETYHTCGNC